MGVVQLSDALERLIDRQVAEGRAADSVAFLEEAVMRLVDATDTEEAEIARVAEAGNEDIEAGRYTTIVTAEDSERLYESLMERLRARLAAGE